LRGGWQGWERSAQYSAAKLLQSAVAQSSQTSSLPSFRQPCEYRSGSTLSTETPSAALAAVVLPSVVSTPSRKASRSSELIRNVATTMVLPPVTLTSVLVAATGSNVGRRNVRLSASTVSTGASMVPDQLSDADELVCSQVRGVLSQELAGHLILFHLQPSLFGLSSHRQ
jgi:hypothetical protein